MGRVWVYGGVSVSMGVGAWCVWVYRGKVVECVGVWRGVGTWGVGVWGVGCAWASH